jgi:hypothetical protein
MTSPVDITNRALQAIGTRSTIAAMDEGSNESNNASLCYATTRQELIRSAPWNFATATATLALLKSAPGTLETPLWPASGVWSTAYPPPGWSYEYAYPADCLRARKVVANYPGSQGVAVSIFPTGLAAAAMPLWDLPGVRFQVTTDQDVNGNPVTVILANIDQGILCYLRDITIEDIWDPLFCDAMVQALAGKLALALTGDKQLAEQRFQMANKAVLEARAADGNEGLTVLDHEADWITRGHGVRWVGPGQAAGYSLGFGSLFGGY